MHKGVLLDTSFFIHLLDENDTLHNNAKEYYKYFLDHNYEMCISTNQTQTLDFSLLT